MKNTIKAIIKKIPIDFTKNQKYDTLTKKIMRIVLEKDSSFVDVGCHKGEVLLEAIKFAPNGFHFGFEPIPTLYEQLILDFGKNCDIRQVGLSNSRGVSKFNYVKTNPAYSGIKKRAYPKQESIEEITIKLDTLDHQLFDATRVDFIKIDVEGGELNVLRGGVNIIRKFNPVIVFEYGLGASEFYNATPKEMWGFFDDVKYNIYTLKNFIESPSPISSIEFEGIFNTNKEYYFVARFRSS
mgnify:CR=1 FL=1